MHVDDVAVDFPELPIVLAHPSFPWQDEAISVALHKQQVWIDPLRLVAEVLPGEPRPLREHAPQGSGVLFGSDYPLITPDRWLADFEQAGFKEEGCARSS